MAPQSTRHASTRSTAQLGVGALMLGFVFLSWCVLVGGLSAVQHRGMQASPVSYLPTDPAAFGFESQTLKQQPAAAANDRNALEFEWWVSIRENIMLWTRFGLRQ